MTKRTKIIVLDFLALISLIGLSSFVAQEIIWISTKVFTIIMSIYFVIVIGLIIYNFIKKKNYEAKSHLIFFGILLFLLILCLVVLFYTIGSGMPAMRY